MFVPETIRELLAELADAEEAWTAVCVTGWTSTKENDLKGWQAWRRKEAAIEALRVFAVGLRRLSSHPPGVGPGAPRVPRAPLFRPVQPIPPAAVVGPSPNHNEKENSSCNR